jgi:uncharacterized protein (TIGR02996 family)
VRTFEYRDGKSDKFWNIDLRGDRFTVTFGRAGTAGQTQTKQFADADKARAAHDKLVAEKVAKGYVENTPGAGPRRFELDDGKSQKFWSVGLQGNSFIVTYGRIGTAGQAQTKQFADADKARKECDKLIAEKLAKGYVEKAPAAAPAPLQLALEEALAENPDDLAANMAYADHLQEHGDPRGEFIQVQLALEDPSRTAAERKGLREREAALLKKHARQWLGGVAPLRGVKYKFARGWLDSLEIASLTVPLARILARAPQTRLLRFLVIERLEDYSWNDEESYEPGEDIPEQEGPEDAPGLFPLLRSPYLTNVCVFQLGIQVDDEEKYRGETRDTTDSAGAVDLIKKMPRLVELYWLAHGETRDLKALFGLKTLGHLQVLQVYHVEAPYPLEVLARNPALGQLTDLSLHPHGWDFDVEGKEAFIELPELRAVLRSPHLKNLTHLRVHASNIGDPGCREIVASGVLRRLKLLDLRHGCITDDGAHTLAACPDLKNLEVLDVSRNALTRKGVNALKAVGIPVRAEAQQDQGDLEMRRYLYEGDYE